MNDAIRGNIMRMLAILSAILIFSVLGAGEVPPSIAGQNEEPNLENSPIISIESDKIISADNEYEITVFLNEDADENASEVLWITQICINSGICYPPKSTSLIKSQADNFTAWQGKIKIEEDTTYVNWKFEFLWKNNTETSVPEQGFGWKVWSTCWFAEGNWGGVDAPCDIEEENIIPGFEIHTVFFSVIIGINFYSNRMDR